MTRGYPVHCIVVAGGTGQRMGAARPKQFLELHGRSLLAWSIDSFLQHLHLGTMIIVSHAHWLNEARIITEDVLGDSIPFAVVSGGEYRQDSCRLGLEALHADPEDIVLIHDAARPVIDPALVQRIVAAARSVGAAIPVIEVTDSLVQSENGLLLDYIDRSSVHRVQTPQGFRFSRILEVHRQSLLDGDHSATDDASLINRYGYPVAVVQGDPGNIKITTEEDLPAAAARLVRP